MKSEVRRLKAEVFLAVAFCLLPSAFCLELDNFNDISRWKAAPAAGVEMHLSKDAGRHGSALRIDFDFHGHGGYAIARRELPIDLPPNFEFSFFMRAEAPRNTLEFKLIDTTGENVWWTTRRELDFPREWTRIAVRKSQIEFAWGPTRSAAVPRHIGALEIVVTAGTGGKGTVWIDDFTLESIESTSELPPPYGPFHRQSITIDMKQRREFGGMTVEWEHRVPYKVELSTDGNEWFSAARPISAAGRDYISTPDAEARFIRVTSPQIATLKRLALKPVAWSKTPNDFFTAMAADSKRGDWPRYLYGEQSYWTIVGADANPVEALVSEDGAVELGNARCSIEPF
ncbi:MAG TPA: discoidin domain-containing protein, partial [Thermoanaerobaculia bacterium]